MSAYTAVPSRAALARRAATLATAAAVLAATGVMPAANATVRLVGVSAQGNAVLIEATEPVAYSVSRPDPLTLFIDLRNVSAEDARNDVRRQGAIAGVRLEQTTAVDGRTVARVRLSLTREAEHKVRSARNLIRVELTPGAGPDPVARTDETLSRTAPLVTPAAPARAAAAGATQDTAAAPQAPPPDPMSALKLVAPPVERRVQAERAERQTGGPAPANPERASAARAGNPTPAAAQPPAPRSAPRTDPGQGAPPAEPEQGSSPAPQPSGSEPPSAPAGQPAQAPPPAPAPPRLAPPAGGQPAQTAPTLAQAGQSAPAAQPAAQPARTRETGTQITTDGQKQYTGFPLSMDFAGEDLRAVLRVFAEASGLNMIIDPDVQGSVDIVLTDVPWDQALDVILKANQLDYTVDGTIVRIARIETLRREQEARQALAKAQADAGSLSVRTFPLSYARAAEAAPLVRRAALSARGDVQMDERTNMLIITDLPARLDTAATLLAALDKPEPQVEIEARIVSTSRDFSRAVGVEWGLNGRVSPQLGNTTGLAFPNNGSLGGRLGTQGPQGTDVRADPNNQTGTVVSLPSSIPPVGAIGLALGSVNGAFNLDIALSAAEASGKVRILSTPRVTTQNNVAAEMMQGVQIPVQTQANNTVTVTFKDAALTLRVTPQITAAQTVIMAVELENASPGDEVQGIPSINTQRARTTVQVHDGATTIIGGVLINQERESESRVPGLHRVPLLGWLFKRNTNEDDSRELLIFITPRILKS